MVWFRRRFRLWNWWTRLIESVICYAPVLHYFSSIHNWVCCLFGSSFLTRTLWSVRCWFLVYEATASWLESRHDFIPSFHVNSCRATCELDWSWLLRNYPLRRVWIKPSGGEHFHLAWQVHLLRLKELVLGEACLRRLDCPGLLHVLRLSHGLLGHHRVVEDVLWLRNSHEHLVGIVHSHHSLTLNARLREIDQMLHTGQLVVNGLSHRSRGLHRDFKRSWSCLCYQSSNISAYARHRCNLLSLNSLHGCDFAEIRPSSSNFISWFSGRWSIYRCNSLLCYNHLLELANVLGEVWELVVFAVAKLDPFEVYLLFIFWEFKLCEHVTSLGLVRLRKRQGFNWRASKVTELQFNGLVEILSLLDE